MASKERTKLSAKDIRDLGLWSIFLQISFSFERMQAAGFTAGMLPAFRKMVNDDPDELRRFMKYNMEFVNTEPHAGTFLQGLVLSMEESGTDQPVIEGMRNGLFGPLAGIGDSLFWFTVLPIVAGICCSLSQQGSILGPILFILLYLGVGFLRIPFGQLGYTMGTRAMEGMQEVTKYLTRGAAILGATVLGALIPSYVAINFSDACVFGLGEGTTVQSVFDALLPNILPLAVTFGIYWLIKEKHVNAVYIILAIICFGLAMSFIGWM